MVSIDKNNTVSSTVTIDLLTALLIDLPTELPTVLSMVLPTALSTVLPTALPTALPMALSMALSMDLHTVLPIASSLMVDANDKFCSTLASHHATDETNIDLPLPVSPYPNIFLPFHCHCITGIEFTYHPLYSSNSATSDIYPHCY